MPPAIAGVTTAVALRLILARPDLPLDRPNERSLHARPVPRVGGFALIPATLAGWLALGIGPPWPVWAAVCVLFVLSALDDVRGLPVSVRLLSHLIAALTVAITVLGDTHGWPMIVAMTLAITWMVNLYNFMDGADGLAGGMALIGFSALAVAAWWGADAALASACAAVAAAALGFLLFNFPPARVFMGDAGSVPLGLLAGAFAAIGWSRGLWPAWFPLLVFAPFVVDATVTLARRLARGERVWQAHREHYYQRLVRQGWGHRGTALAEYALMLGSAALALASLGRTAGTQAAILALAAIAYLALMRSVDAGWRRHAAEKR